jgi:hypothetical protein
MGFKPYAQNGNVFMGKWVKKGIWRDGELLE